MSGLELDEDELKIKKCLDSHILYTDTEELEDWIPHEYLII